MRTGEGTGVIESDEISHLSIAAGYSRACYDVDLKPVTVKADFATLHCLQHEELPRPHEKPSLCVTANR